jgi:capsular polysaccharide biosynthesis protein
MVGSGLKVMVADALLVVSATLVAVTVTACWLATVDGAVYRPAPLIVPVAGLRLHVTAVLAAFATMAVNCWVCEGERVAVKGATLTVTGGTNVTVAEAVLVLSAALVAVTMADC